MIVDNLHKKRFVRDLLCWMGRHDYEAVRIDGRYVVLECFYCLHGKKSYLRETKPTETP